MHTLSTVNCHGAVTFVKNLAPSWAVYGPKGCLAAASYHSQLMLLPPFTSTCVCKVAFKLQGLRQVAETVKVPPNWKMRLVFPSGPNLPANIYASYN
eukprot:3602448-Amphidinium_carterae.1